MKKYGGGGCLDPRFLDLGTSWAPTALQQRNETPVPIGYEAGLVPEPVLTSLDDVEKRKVMTLPEFELTPLGRAACSQSLYLLG
jgi:hypothetical protein